MIYRCRHAVFAEFFGDTKPKCENRCDVCTDRKLVEQHLNTFAMERQEYKTFPKSAVAFTEDAQDMYGGGRGAHNTLVTFSSHITIIYVKYIYNESKNWKKYQLNVIYSKICY